MDREHLLDEAWVVKAADDVENQLKAISIALSRASKIVGDLDGAADPGIRVRAFEDQSRRR
ncbi:hypothetical protein ACOJBO_37170 [Rhizobium beringeri]